MSVFDHFVGLGLKGLKISGNNLFHRKENSFDVRE